MDSWEKRLIYMRPETERPTLARPVADDPRCPMCGRDSVARYPVANHQGPRILTRCQSCFHTVSLTRPGPQDQWPPFRSATYDWDPAPAERGVREPPS